MSYFTRHLINEEEYNSECEICGVYSEDLKRIVHIIRGKLEICPFCWDKIKSSQGRKNENNV
jgi:ribosome-binding protein aMBF1 (putative translation factor)